MGRRPRTALPPVQRNLRPRLQFSATEDVALQRSGWSGDLGDRQFWYDGKSVTLHDPATSFYAAAIQCGVH